MGSFLQFTWTELKLYLREPVPTFFTLVFPLIMLLLFGSIYGNKPNPLFGGFGSVDVSVPAYTAMIIAVTGIFSIPICITEYRQKGFLRRLRITPLRTTTILLTIITVALVMTLAGAILLVITGKIIYELRFEGNIINVLAGFFLSALSIYGIGFVLAGLTPTVRSAQAVSMVIFYPMIFLTGATIPREILPETVRQIGSILPLTYVVNLLRGLWLGGSWGEHLIDVGILVGLLLAGIIISSRTFRWE